MAKCRKWRDYRAALKKGNIFGYDMKVIDYVTRFS
jgi:hypothetical protein